MKIQIASLLLITTLLAGCATVNSVRPDGSANFVKRSGLSDDVKNLWLTAKIIDAKSAFSTKDQKVTWWAEFQPMSFVTPQQFSARWYAPDGSLFTETQGRTFDTNAMYGTCSLPISGSQAAHYSGIWRVDVFWRNAKIDSQSFSISDPTLQSDSLPAPSSDSPKEEGPWTTYLESNQGLQVRYPSSWFRKEHSNPPVYQLFLSREKVTKPGDIFQVGISILQIQNASAQLNLKTSDPVTAASLLLESYIKNCPGLMKKHAVNTPVRIGNSEGYLSDLETRDALGKNVRLWLVYLLQDDVLTNLIFECPREEFSKYEPIFRQFLEESNIPGSTQHASLVQEPFHLTREVSDEDVLIKELDLSVSRPANWIVLQFDDPHHLVSFCKQNPPSPTEPVITASLLARINKSIPDLARAVIMEKARLLKGSTLIQIGNTRPEKIGDWKGFKETYVFSIEGTSVGFVYFFIPTRDFLYVFTYSNKFESLSEYLEVFNAVIEKSRFENERTKLPEGLVKSITEAQLRIATEKKTSD